MSPVGCYKDNGEVPSEIENAVRAGSLKMRECATRKLQIKMSE
jgi:hypothetical protein